MEKKYDPYGYVQQHKARVSLDLDSEEILTARSAFGYYGSKQRISKKILEHLPPHYCWVELFSGSAAITLAKHPAKIEIINDLDQDIVNVFRQLRDRPQELIRAMMLTPYAREEYNVATYRMDEVTDELERARRFLVRAMMSVNGVLGKNRGGFSFTNSYSRSGKEARVSRWSNYAKRLNEVVNRLRDIRVESVDGLKFLREFSNRPATLIYIDPPYLAKRSAGYVVDVEDEEFHIELLGQANISKCMILISGYDSEMYNDLLTKRNGWTKITIETSTKSTTGSSFNRHEILWVNAAAAKAKRMNRVPIRLSKEERSYQKFNPIRGPKIEYSLPRSRKEIIP